MLSATLYYDLSQRYIIEIEFHTELESRGQEHAAFEDGQGARVADIVIRLDTHEPGLWRTVGLLSESVHATTLASIDSSMARFPHLRTVTLETIDQDEGELLVGESFPALFGSGQLRLRTCEEAWQAAQDERYDSGALDEPGIVSPLWYTYANEPGDHFTSMPERQAQWYVPVIHVPSATSTHSS